jgi:Lrp/AsnC family transcriptional regulator, leucine-responsive regulatory protein
LTIAHDATITRILRLISSNFVPETLKRCAMTGLYTMDQLDSFDRAILAIVQQDATLSNAELGERVNLSASATLRRVQRMRESGAIVATRVILNPQRVGYPLTVIVEISLENEQAAALQGMQQALIDDPYVQLCYYVTGDADLIAILAIPDMPAYKSFTDRHFVGNPHIKKFKTSVAMDCMKTTTAYPV